MNGKQHLTAGVTLTVLDVAIYENIIHNWTDERIINCVKTVGDFVLPNHILFYPLCFAFLFLGFLLPDCDNRKSFIGRYFHVPVEHRTWMHTLYIILAFLVIGLFFHPFIWLAFGYFQHLVCDSPSRCGVCWLNPYGYKRYNHAKIKKGHYIYLYSSESTAWMLCGVFVAITIMYIIGALGFTPLATCIDKIDTTIETIIVNILSLFDFVKL